MANATARRGGHCGQGWVEEKDVFWDGESREFCAAGQNEIIVEMG